MIRPLRTIHRRVFFMLGVALPAVFAISIAARKPPAIADNLPSELTAAPVLFHTAAWERSGLFAKTGIGLRLMREHAASGAFAVRLLAPKEFARPDVIVYWAAGEIASPDALPENAQLLGAFSARELKLPADAANREGRLILFSLADQEIVEISKPFAAAAANKR